MAVSLPGSQVTLRWCLMGQGMMQAESCCLPLPPTGGEEEELGSFPCGNSQLLCLLGLEPPSGAQHPASPMGLPIPGGSQQDLVCPARGWEQLCVVSVPGSSGAPAVPIQPQWQPAGR